MRNFEKYKTAEERAKAFHIFCNSFNDDCEKCPLAPKCEEDHASQMWLEAFAWLELEVEEEKPLPCPFCEHSVNIVRTGIGVLSCKCTCCTYSSSDYDNADEAIAAHNRVARAVMADKDKANDKEAK